jgi:hypothetical protein
VCGGAPRDGHLLELRGGSPHARHLGMSNTMHPTHVGSWVESDRRSPEAMMNEAVSAKNRLKVLGTAGLAAMAVAVLALGYFGVTGVVDPGGRGAAAAAEQEGIPRIDR